MSEDCSDLEDAAQEPPTYGLARRVDSVVHCVQQQSGRESPSLQAPVTRAVSTEATDRERAPLVGWGRVPGLVEKRSGTFFRLEVHDQHTACQGGDRRNAPWARVSGSRSERMTLNPAR